MHKLLSRQIQEALATPGFVPDALRPLLEQVVAWGFRPEGPQAASAEPDAAALRELQRASQLILDSSREMILGLATDGSIVFINRAGAERLGWGVEELEGQPHAALHPPSPGHAESCPLMQCLAEGRARKVDVDTFWTRDGQPLAVQYTVTPQREGDQPLGVVVVAREHVEREELMERLVSSDRLASLGTLAAGVAHEINNPLAYVVSNMEFVAEQLRSGEETDPETRQEILAALREAQEGSQRIARIVMDLRSFSRGSDESKALLDPAEVMRAAVAMVRHQVRHRAALIEDLQPVASVLASRSRLEQVFVNLILNAAQAIPEGNAAEQTITVRSRPRGQDVELEVQDTGVGMTPEVLQRIFDPFFSTRPAGSAVGMGLAVCHGIVTGMGGSISVRSEVGQGSTFTLFLPTA